MNNKSQGLSFAYRYSSQISTAIALIILCIVMSFLSDSFLSVGNLLTVTNQVVYIALMAIGMTALFMLGAIDLSVGSTLALSACIIQAEYGYSDEETALQLQENPYLQYFCGME